jgi:hypothetical protein
VAVPWLRDENEAEMDETQYFHICFHIFYERENGYRNSGNKYKKQILTETNTERILHGHGRKTDEITDTKNPFGLCREIKAT